MRATPLRHRLNIYQQETGRSSTGAVKSKKWQHVLTIWGHFSPLSVKDVLVSQAERINVTARAKIRYRSDLRHDMRVQYAGKMYEIVGEPLADDKTGKEYLTLMLKSVSSED